MNKLKKLLFLFLPLGLLSCVTLNSHQTGRSEGKGHSSFMANFNFGYINSDQYFTYKDSGAFYMGEMGVYIGIKENLDIGLKVNSSSHFTALSKYQFIGNKASFFAASIGLDVGAAPLAMLMGAMSYNSTVSLYTSMHPEDYLAFTLSPRYTYLGFTNFTKEYNFTRQNNIYGYSAGVIIGKKHQFSLELSQFVNNEKFSFDREPIVSLGYILKLE